MTDSTAALDAAELARSGIVVVPLQVTAGARTGLDGSVVTAEHVALALRAHHRVHTSQPSPAAFAEAFGSAEPLEGRGGGVMPAQVVAVHVAQAFSGTVGAARRAAAAVAPGVLVDVVDSGSVAMGTGFAALAAAAAAAAGADRADVAAAAYAAAQRTRTLFSLDSLEYLRRGGRIGATAALFGSALSVKPLLGVRDGALAVLDRVRTSARATARLVDLAAAAAGDLLGQVVSQQVEARAGDQDGRAPLLVAIHHVDSPARAADLADRVRSRLPDAAVSVRSVGAVVAAHTGPGLLGIVLHAPGAA